MGSLGSAIAVLATLVLWAYLCRWLLDNPRGDPGSGFLYRASGWYVQQIHQIRVDGNQNIPAPEDAGPLIVIANHTAGVDPVLVQTQVPFEIRWMMSQDMRLPVAEPFWKWARIISVNQNDRGGIAAVREAVRHLRRGGVLGIFPEGGIERPPRQVMPFRAGVGTLIKKTGARVLPVIIDGTPQVDPAWSSLWRHSRSSVRFMPIIDYADSGLTHLEIAHDLHARYLEWTGWPANEQPLDQAARTGK